MAVKINSTELIEILESMPANQNIMLLGKHGIGKSQILTQFFFCYQSIFQIWNQFN